MENFETQFNKGKEEETDDPQKEMVPESETSERFSRSGGPGGQNVNKLSTKAERYWNIDESKKFTAEQKEKIKQFLGKRVSKDGWVKSVSQKERTQFQNREQAQKQLNDWVKTALESEKERIPTKPTRSSKERRLEEKKRLGEKKKWRSKEFD